MKNHERIDGRLLQTNKRYSNLKQKQKDKIAVWMYEETKQYYEKTGIYPDGHHLAAIVDAVYNRIEKAEIWIPYGEVEKHYRGKLTQMNRRIRREVSEKHHPAEKVIFMNMCMICDGYHNVGLLYCTSSFTGKLQSSDEGRVYWIPRQELEKKPLAAGMLNVLKIMEQEQFTECFMDVHSDGTITEHIF